MLIFRPFHKRFTFETPIALSISRAKIKCYISKSKLILWEYNAFYFREIAFIGFTLHEIKQCIVFCGQPVLFLWVFPTLPRAAHGLTSSVFSALYVK